MGLRESRILALAWLLALAGSTAARAAPAPGLDPAALAASAVPVRSLDLDDGDFDDLEPLRAKIGDARVVVLGEGTHAEGTTSRAKARMVRFLHESMGFDAVVWESGRFSAQGLNETLRDPAVPLAKAATWLSTWGDDAAVRPLLQYARDSWRGEHPLIMAGMDRSRAAGSSERFLAEVAEVGRRVPALALDTADAEALAALAVRAFSLQRPKSQLPPEARRQHEREVLTRWQQRLAGMRPALRERYSAAQIADLEYLVQDALACEAFNWLAATDFERGNAVRDRMMADNLRWLLDHELAGRKVIVWVATAHMLRESGGIHHLEGDWDHPTWYAGNAVHPWLGDDLYTIAFTAHSGQWGFTYADPARPPRVEPMPPPTGDSFEAAAHALGRPALFVDLRRVPEGNWLAGNFVSFALGHEANRATWRRHLDAFFYIDTAEPLAR